MRQKLPFITLKVSRIRINRLKTILNNKASISVMERDGYQLQFGSPQKTVTSV